MIASTQDSVVDMSAAVHITVYIYMQMNLLQHNSNIPRQIYLYVKFFSQAFVVELVWHILGPY